MTDQTSYEVAVSNDAAEELIEVTSSVTTLMRRQRVAAATKSAVSKRTMDVLLALAIALFFAPIIVTCWLVLLASGGPVVFSQTRVGKNAQKFKIYKFRTMVPDAPAVLKKLLAENAELRAEYERDHKLKNDPRVTPVGRFLRRTSLDELPQLWNVLKGEMSIVGPRPVEMFEMAKYGVHAHYYYGSKPGLTGLWQISGRSNLGYEQRVAMDTYYSRKQSLILDIIIVAKTVRVVLFRSGAY